MGTIEIVGVSLSTGAAAGIAAGVAAGTVLLALLVYGLVRRSRRGPDERIDQAVSELSSRMEAMGRDLSDALERTREETRRTRVLGELAGSIDLDEVVNRTLDAAAALPGADAALITVAADDSDPVTAAVGLSQEEAEEYGVGQPPTGRRIRSLALDYNEAPMLRPGQVPPIASARGVPIRAESEPLGLLLVFSRAAHDAFDDETTRELEALALRAGPALDNARRFREARHLADLDALTGLHNRRYFHETLSREVSRALRYNRRLALIIFDLDDFKRVNDEVGHLAGDAVLAEVADRVRDVVRTADVPSRVGGDEFAIILPESTAEDAEQLFARLQAGVSSRPIAQAGRIGFSAGIAELRPTDDPFVLYNRADQALYRAKEAGKGRAARTEEQPLEEPGAVA